MPRYILIQSAVGAPPRESYRVWARGTSVADSAENALPGDVVWPALCAAPSPVNMAPMDAAALALMPGSKITTLADLGAGRA